MSQAPISGMLDTLAVILAETGAEALGYFDNLAARQVDAKAPEDPVSDADRAVETLLRERLTEAFPDFAVPGGEFGGEATDDYWAVDPIDGTSNFLSGLPFWTISLGLMQKGLPVVGGIIAPALGLCVIDGMQQPLRITGLSSGSQPRGTPCVGIGRNTRWSAADRGATEAAIEAAGLAPRLFGSCALSLMLVATGRPKGYIEPRVGGIWDRAVGLALCRAAGFPVAFGLHPDGTVDVLAGGVFAIAEAAGWSLDGLTIPE